MLLAVLFAITLEAIGGSALLVRGAVVQVLACGATAMPNGFAFAPVTRMPELLASMPLLLIFPMLLSVFMHRLARRVRRQNRVLREIGRVDVLRGLLNRRHWGDAVKAALAGTLGQAVLLLIDIEHFKRVNDQHGHTAGDEVVRVVGAAIHNAIRERDLAGRYGGDEFATVLPDADPATAGQVAERIRTRVARKLAEDAAGLHCTLSIDIAARPPDNPDLKEWVKLADGALHRAKARGRDRFEWQGGGKPVRVS